MKYFILFAISYLFLGCKQSLGPNGSDSEDQQTNTTNSLKWINDSLGVIEIGKINLPTGKVVACDPFFSLDAVPFKQKVPPGKYPVELTFKKIEKEHFRVAYAKIIFKPEKAIKQELAITSDFSKDEMDPLKEGEFYGFGVDAGLACFADETSISELTKRMNENYNYYEDVLADEFKKTTENYSFSREDWVNHVLTKEDNLNVMIFSSGWGDGYYPTYWGLNKNNKIVELKIDFLVN